MVLTYALLTVRTQPFFPMKWSCGSRTRPSFGSGYATSAVPRVPHRRISNLRSIVKVPMVSPGSDFIWVYFNKASQVSTAVCLWCRLLCPLKRTCVLSQNSVDTFAEYLGVWHMNGTFRDATGKNDGTDTGTSEAGKKRMRACLRLQLSAVLWLQTVRSGSAATTLEVAPPTGA